MFIYPYVNYKHNEKSGVRIDWDEYQQTCSEIRIWILTELMKLGYQSQINNTNRYGNTPLIFACALKDIKVIKLLLNYGACITQPPLPRSMCTCPKNIASISPNKTKTHS